MDSPDLRDLTTDALRAVAHNGPFLTGPPHGRRLAEGYASKLAAAVLAAVLPAHRRQVLDGAADAIQAVKDRVRRDLELDTPADIAAYDVWHGAIHEATVALRRLADDTPPTPPSAGQSAHDGPAVPEDARLEAARAFAELVRRGSWSEQQAAEFVAAMGISTALEGQT